MTPQTLTRLGFGAAALGGALRILSAFVPYVEGSLPLELLYAVIDLALLFGLITIYLSESQVAGACGLTAFVIALSGIASIVGPDTTAFDVDFYQLGAAITAIGMAALGVAFILAGRLILPSLFWIGAPVAAAATTGPIAVQMAGILFGLGFLTAGAARVTQSQTAP